LHLINRTNDHGLPERRISFKALGPQHHLISKVSDALLRGNETFNNEKVLLGRDIISRVSEVLQGEVLQGAVILVLCLALIVILVLCLALIVILVSCLIFGLQFVNCGSGRLPLDLGKPNLCYFNLVFD
jgi:hypothetical protein